MFRAYLLLIACIFLIVSCEKDNSDIPTASDDLFAIKEWGSWGFIDKSGKVIIPVKFEGAFNFIGEYAVVQKDRQVGLIDKTGAFVISPDFDGLRQISDNGYIAANKDGLVGYINLQGEWVIEAQYEFVYGFQEGLSVVEKDYKSGMINELGQEIVPMEHYSIGNLCEGYAFVEKNNFYHSKYAQIDQTGKFMSGYIYDPVEYEVESNSFKSITPLFSEGLAIVEINGIPTYINHKGETVLQLDADGAGHFKEGLAKIIKDHKVGYINKRGEVVIDFEYSPGSGDFENGMAVVCQTDGGYMDRKYGVINDKGQMLLPIMYKTVEVMSEDVCMVSWEDHSWGYVDFKGKTIWRSSEWGGALPTKEK